MALQLQVSARDPGCWCGDMDMVACTALSSRALRLTSVTGWQLGRPGAGPGVGVGGWRSFFRDGEGAGGDLSSRKRRRRPLGGPDVPARVSVCGCLLGEEIMLS